MSKAKEYFFMFLILFVSVVLSLSLKPKTTIFTCTTFFDFEKQDKWKAFCKAMDSIMDNHDTETLKRINRWIIVNEYSPNPRRFWKKEVEERYPFCECIQKGPEQKGQAASMNLILKEIKGYNYWIHWEETWYCRAPCLDRMLNILDFTTISQVQATQLTNTPNWLDSNKHPRELLTTPSGIQYYQIFPSKDTQLYLSKSISEYDHNFVANWPLYSLLPSANRVAHNWHGDFSTDPNLWPFKFEWDYGRRWLLAGNTKAVLPDGPVIRDNTNHKSTYA
jgi:hypothetical protein